MSYVAQPVEVEAITDDWLAKTGYKLGYWRRGRTAHLFIKNVLGGDDALCNKTNSPWAEALGTGTQNEYDRARSLPLCTRCADHAMVRTVAGVPVTDCDGLITNLRNANNAAPLDDGVTQTLLAGREDGVPGNCVQAAIATLLKLPIDAVPHFLLWSRWNYALAEWMEERGYETRVLRTTSIPDHRCIVAGMSPRGISHVCVANGGNIVWDPHPSRAGLVSIDEAWTFLPVPSPDSAAL